MRDFAEKALIAYLAMGVSASGARPDSITLFLGRKVYRPIELVNRLDPRLGEGANVVLGAAELLRLKNRSVEFAAPFVIGETLQPTKVRRIFLQDLRIWKQVWGGEAFTYRLRIAATHQLDSTIVAKFRGGETYFRGAVPHVIRYEIVAGKMSQYQAMDSYQRIDRFYLNNGALRDAMGRRDLKTVIDLATELGVDKGRAARLLYRSGTEDFVVKQTMGQTIEKLKAHFPELFEYDLAYRYTPAPTVSEGIKKYYSRRSTGDLAPLE